MYRTFREAVQNAARFRVSAAKVRGGHLVCAQEVFGLTREPAGCGLSIPLLSKHEDSLYRIYDFYCMNPSCRCEEAHLTVARVENNEKMFSARMGFDAKVTYTDTSDAAFPMESVVEFLSEWLRQYPAALPVLQARYLRIKAVGKRLVKRKK
jgi:hypothetical protein